jgi:hypothetical protein
MSKPETDDGRARRDKQDFEVGYGKPPKATRFSTRPFGPQRPPAQAQHHLGDGY